MKIAIIGAGASGLFFANALLKFKKNYDITIFERNKSEGRKLLSTGNGKCNFFNQNVNSTFYNHPTFFDSLLKECSYDELLNYILELGLAYKVDEEGRMYPISESSQSVLDILLRNLGRVHFKYETIYHIKKYHEGFLIENEYFDKLILASGSNSSIDLKKVDSTYSYLSDLNISLTKLRPSLVGFKIKNHYDILKGFRSKALVKLMVNDKLIHEEAGEVIFKEDGISGIVIMNMSFYYEENMKNKLVLDLFPNLTYDNLLNLLTNDKFKKNPYVGILHPKLISLLNDLKIKDPKKIALFLKEFNLDILSTYSFKESQVTRGGIPLDLIDTKFNFKKDKNLYAIGEILDMDGLCGGFNLLFAFLSAYICAKEI